MLLLHPRTSTYIVDDISLFMGYIQRNCAHLWAPRLDADRYRYVVISIHLPFRVVDLSVAMLKLLPTCFCFSFFRRIHQKRRFCVWGETIPSNFTAGTARTLLRSILLVYQCRGVGRRNCHSFAV